MCNETNHTQCATNRKRIFVFFILLTVSCFTILHTNFASDFYYVKPLQNTTCHSKDSDKLVLIDGNYTARAKTIYFHETSCVGALNSRQACSIESAARQHPHWQVIVLFAGPVAKSDFDKESFKSLKKYENVNFFRLYLLDYAKGTPLEGMVRDGALNRSRWRISHTSDALRYLTLYKWGGVYLDLDVIVAKSFEGLAANWGARESDKAVAAGAMAFSQDRLGRFIAEAAIRNFRNNFRGDIWGHNGPGVMTRILKKICKTKTMSKMSASSCIGFEVYGPELFYPITWQDAKQYFELQEIPSGDPYAYHIWNKVTEQYKVYNQSIYSKLARKYCPITYESYGDKFGL